MPHVILESYTIEISRKRTVNWIGFSKSLIVEIFSINNFNKATRHLKKNVQCTLKRFYLSDSFRRRQNPAAHINRTAISTCATSMRPCHMLSLSITGQLLVRWCVQVTMVDFSTSFDEKWNYRCVLTLWWSWETDISTKLFNSLSCWDSTI